MEVVLTTATPEGVIVVLRALVYAKVLEEHAAVADLGLIDRTIRTPHERHADPRPRRERFLRRELDCGFSRWWSSVRSLSSSLPCSPLSVPLSDMAVATVHVSAADLELTGSYESVGDVLYLSAVTDDKSGPAQETPEGHAVRLDGEGRVTRLTAINAKLLLNRDGELVATLRDGRRLRLGRDDVADLID